MSSNVLSSRLFRDPCHEPGSSHTLRERVQYLQRYLPPISTIFGPCGSYDPSASFPQWQSFLSDQPADCLSFSKTQDSLPRSVINIERLWDVDCVWFGAKSLQAIRPPNDFLLCFLPPFQRNISIYQVIQPHGLNLEGTGTYYWVPSILAMFDLKSSSTFLEQPAVLVQRPKPQEMPSPLNDRKISTIRL